MIKAFQSIYNNDGAMSSLRQIEDFAEIAAGKGIWINVSQPSYEEVDQLSEALGIEKLAIQYALDENEAPRIEVEDEYILIILNYPVLMHNGYDTRPLGIILTDRAVMTVAREPIDFLQPFMQRQVKTFGTHKKGRFVFQIFYRIVSLYMTYLAQMGKRLDTAEEKLRRTTENEELIKLLSLNNSLTYFSTSLRGNQTVLEKISRTDPFRIYEEDRDLLEDISIENRQAIEMTKMYINVLSSTMDAYASIINNNLNTTLRFMTAWTIVIMVPTFVVSMFGMNVHLPLQHHPHAYQIIMGICLVLGGALIAFFTRKGFFGMSKKK